MERFGFALNAQLGVSGIFVKLILLSYTLDLLGLSFPLIFKQGERRTAF